MNENKVYSVCVIGGGSAGVMAALRTVLNNDECLLFPGTPKNKKRSRAFWVSKVENMPAHFSFKKGIEDPNKEVISWIESSSFADKLIYKKNEGVESLEKKDDLFIIHSSKGDLYYCRFVILCTGIMDVQPEINGTIAPILPYANVQLADYCLRCDGHHSLNKNISIFGNGDGAAWVGIMLKERYDCPSVTILTNGEKVKDFSKEVKNLIQKYNIEIISERVTEVIGDHRGKSLDGYKIDTGEIIDTDFTIISLGMIVYNELAIQVGAELDSRGFVITNKYGESSTSGMFVAGDLRANAKKQIYTAWDHAVDSADKINSLIRYSRRN